MCVYIYIYIYNVHTINYNMIGQQVRRHPAGVVSSGRDFNIYIYIYIYLFIYIYLSTFC